MFAVNKLPSEYGVATKKLKEIGPACLNEENSKMFLMPDGCMRHTHASLSENPTAPPYCINDQARVISRTFDQINFMVTNLITKIAGEENVQWTNSTSPKPQSLYEATHKDHIHVYQKGKNEAEPEDPNYLLPFHVDNGLYLLLTPFPEHPLLVQDRSGEVISTSGVRSDSVLVMMARGLNEWLLRGSPMESEFHAVPHAVLTLNKNPNIISRTVYARMRVLPHEAIPFQSRKKRDVITFGDAQMQRFKRSDDQNGGQEYAPGEIAKHGEDGNQAVIGREHGRYNLDGEECAQGQAFCWRKCRALPTDCNMPIVCYSMEKQKYCSSNATDAPVIHDTTCNWSCGTQPGQDNNGKGDGDGNSSDAIKANLLLLVLGVAVMKIVS